VPAGTPTLLAPENHSRVCLIIGVSGAQQVQVAPRASVLQTTGIALSASGTSYIPITFGDFGPLVGVEWWGNAVGLAVVEVIEVIRDFDPDRPILPLEY
jgi:hypothetical protein